MGIGVGIGAMSVGVGPNPNPGHHDGTTVLVWFEFEVAEALEALEAAEVAARGACGLAMRPQHACRAATRSVDEKGRWISDRFDCPDAHARTGC